MTTESKQEELPKVSSRQDKAGKKQNKKMRRFFAQMKQSQIADKHKFKRKLEILKSTLGKADFNALKEICTVKTEEKKNEQGEIITPASSKVNYKALFTEGALAIVLNREARIRAGKRKRTTGRSSDRTSHNEIVKFINKRNKELAENGN